MARWLGFFLLVTVSAAQAQQVDHGKLREAVCIPRPPMNFRHGGNVKSADMDPTVADIEKRLKGNEEDAEHYLRLAGLYNQATEKDKVQQALQKAAALLARRVEAPDCTGWQLAMYGRAQVELERVEEGLAFCRKAVEASPKDYRCWRELIHAHKKRCYLALSGGKEFNLKWDVNTVKQAVQINGVTLAQIAQADKHLAEIWPCYEKMAELAPKTEEAVLERMAFALEGKMLEKTFMAAQGNLSWELAAQAFVNPLFVEELLNLGDARKSDLNTYAMAVNVQLMLLQIENGMAKRDELTKEQKARLVRVLSRVSPLAGSADRDLAWGAAMMVGVFLEQFVEKSACEAFYRRAVKLCPEKEQGAQNLASCLAGQGKTKEALDLLKEQYERTPSLALGLHIAHQLLEEKQVDRAEALITELAGKHGDQPQCKLALAALCLARSADKKQLDEAGKHLDAARLILFAPAAGAEEQDTAGVPRMKTKTVEFNVDDKGHWQKRYQFLNALHLGLTDQNLQSYVELRTLHGQNAGDPWLNRALSAFKD